jgi:hypothetical protein
VLLVLTVFCRPQRLVEDDAQAAKMSDASVTSAANYTRSLDAANHLISLSKTLVGPLGGSADTSSSDAGKNKKAALSQHVRGNSINNATHSDAPTAESTNPMKQASAPTAHLAKGNVCVCACVCVCVCVS